MPLSNKQETSSSNPQKENQEHKDRSYFEFERPEIVALIPESARAVLDIGCGSGRLGELLKKRQQIHVTGIELNREAASAAEKRLDEVHCRNLDSNDCDFPKHQFDCVVCADILEHLREPEKVLRKIRRWLKPDGRLVCSIPNVRHHSVISSLLAGNWTYESAGLLDNDHVRFFTRREIEKLLYRTGFDIDKVQIVPGPGYQEWKQRGRTGDVQIGRLHISGLSPRDAEEFYAYQYLVRSGVTRRKHESLTSIIIVTYNQLAYTRLCIDSIRMRTDEPYELIFVDNGSTDGTVDYLKSLDDVHLITNEDNRGFPAAVNQGMRVAQGDNILLLNNDCVVTTGWLRRMLDAFDRDPQIGLVGPCSNNISGPQQVSVSYESLETLDGFAWDWGCTHEGEPQDERRLVGFCLLIKREVMDKIGYLDEQFGIGCFEDDDYCRRARQVGYRTVMARDAFVHHFGSRTFLGSNVDLNSVLLENQQKYDRKWDQQQEKQARPEGTVKPPSPDFCAEPAPEGGLLLRKKDCKLSLCLIVRDNEDTIEDCLQSIKPWVDEMVVVDTGSQDRTPEIAEKLGARLFHFPWCDDFSAARNQSLRHARGEWIFWMDSDDTIEPECGRRLRELADGDHAPETLGYVMQVHCPGPGDQGKHDVTVVDHVKLFRNRPDLQFEHRIHEQIIPAIRRAGGEVEFTDIYVVHSGSDHTPEGRQKKLERDFHLLELDLEERPDHPFVLFNLGMTHADARQYDEAIERLRRCLEVSHPEESHVRKAYALLVSSCSQAGRYEEAYQHCRRGLKFYPDDKELLFRLGLLEHHFQRLHEAEHAYLRVLEESSARNFASVDSGITGFKARHNLAIVYEDRGQIEKAEEQWRLVVDEQPEYRAGWRGLAEVLFKQEKYTALQQVAEELQQIESLRGEGAVIRARLKEKAQDIDQAQKILQDARKECPGDLEPLRELCRLMFENGRPEKAQSVLQDLTQADPGDASAHHNLGTVYQRAEQFKQAADSFRRSLQLRPQSASTWLQLGEVLLNDNRSQEAIQAWRSGLQYLPNQPQLRAALQQAEHQLAGRLSVPAAPRS